MSANGHIVSTSHHRIVPQHVVIVHFIQWALAKRRGEHALANKRCLLMFDPVLLAQIVKTGSKAINQSARPVGRAEKERAGIRADNLLKVHIQSIFRSY